MEMAVQKFFGKEERLFEEAEFVITDVQLICSENTEKNLCIFEGSLLFPG
jgi:hypothetical protein